MEYINTNTHSKARLRILLQELIDVVNQQEALIDKLSSLLDSAPEEARTSINHIRELYTSLDPELVSMGLELPSEALPDSQPLPVPPKPRRTSKPKSTVA